MIDKKFLDLKKDANDRKSKYILANPFPHTIIDNFFEEEILNTILEEFPKDIDKNGENYNNKAEKKFTLNDISKLSKTLLNL